MTAARKRGRRRPFNWPRMRPRFILEVACGADDVMRSLRDGVADDERGFEGRFSDHHAVLTLPEEELQFWSTQLGLRIEDARAREDGTAQPTRVLGVFSPHPEIWTGYVFTIGILAGLAVFGVMWAIVQASLGHAPWALIASLVAVLLGGLVYLSTLVGQSLALGEMYELRSFLDERLEKARVRALREPKSALDSARL